MSTTGFTTTTPALAGRGARGARGMGRAGSLGANVAWGVAGNATFAACQLGMLVALARLGPPEMVGRFSLALALTSPVLMLTNLQLRTLLASDAARRHTFADYARLRAALSAAALAAVAALALLPGYGGETALVILLVGLSKVFESASDLAYGLAQREERMRPVTLSLVARGVLGLAALVVTVRATGSVAWGAAALSAAWAAVLLFHDIPTCSALLRAGVTGPARALTDGRVRAGGRAASLPWPLLLTAAPLGVVMCLNSLNSGLPRYFVERQLGERGLGVYAAVACLLAVGVTVISSLCQAATPRLARHFERGERAEFGRLMLRLCCFGGALGAAGFLVSLTAGRAVISAAYGPEYAEEAGLLPWLMLGSGVGYVSALLGCGMTAAGRLRVQPPLLLAVCAVTLLSCAALVPAYGLAGAAYAGLISSVVQLVGCAWVVARAVAESRQGVCA